MIVIPVSTLAVRAKRGLTAIVLPQGAGGLNQESAALCHQVTTLDRARLTDKLGALPIELVEQIEQGLKAAMNLPQHKK